MSTSIYIQPVGEKVRAIRQHRRDIKVAEASITKLNSNKNIPQKRVEHSNTNMGTSRTDESAHQIQSSTGHARETTPECYEADDSERLSAALNHSQTSRGRGLSGTGIAVDHDMHAAGLCKRGMQRATGTDDYNKRHHTNGGKDKDKDGKSDYVGKRSLKRSVRTRLRSVVDSVDA